MSHMPSAVWLKVIISDEDVWYIHLLQLQLINTKWLGGLPGGGCRYDGWVFSTFLKFNEESGCVAFLGGAWIYCEQESLSLIRIMSHLGNISVRERVGGLGDNDYYRHFPLTGSRQSFQIFPPGNIVRNKPKYLLWHVSISKNVNCPEHWGAAGDATQIDGFWACSVTQSDIYSL